MKPPSKSKPHLSESPDILTAIATVCLGGALADGKALPLEIKACSQKMQQELLMTRSQSFRVMWKALHHLAANTKGEALQKAFRTLNTHLTPSQRESIYWSIEDIVAADKKYDLHEILYLVHASGNLGISRI